jgi:hypothetical protein
MIKKIFTELVHIDVALHELAFPLYLKSHWLASILFYYSLPQAPSLP